MVEKVAAESDQILTTWRRQKRECLISDSVRVEMTQNMLTDDEQVTVTNQNHNGIMLRENIDSNH